MCPASLEPASRMIYTDCTAMLNPVECASLLLNTSGENNAALPCWPSYCSGSGDIVNLSLRLSICCVFTASERIALLWGSSSLFSVSAVLSCRGNPDDSQREQSAPYSVCQLAGRMQLFATQPTNCATILFGPFPWPLWGKPSKKPDVFLHEDRTESLCLVLLGVRDCYSMN